MIGSFKGKYYFLSNFYEAPVVYGGLQYLNNEAAFQAQKTLDNLCRLEFTRMHPNEAKRLGRQVKLRADWEYVKDNVMYEVVLSKFKQNPGLCMKLLATGTQPLVEGNTWGDKYWGMVNGVGENHLGKILMRVRAELSGVV